MPFYDRFATLSQRENGTMKLVRKNSDCFDQQVHFDCIETPCLDSSWHYHPEYELLYISKSNGIRFVGDSVSPFFPGDLVLVGAYLPHLWRNDVTYYTSQKKKVKTVVMKFTKDFIGDNTFSNPAFASVNQLLELSKYGVSFGKQTSANLRKEFFEIIGLSPAEQRIQLLGILFRLSQSNDRTVLSSSDMRQYAQATSNRLDNVLKYIADNFSSTITLQDVADIAHMTTNSFCRFFKKMTNKSFTQFLNEIRIRHASRLLLERERTVTEVCYLVGYKSMTNFYKQFKQIVGSTPKAFRQGK